MAQQFKVLTYIEPKSESKSYFHPSEFEKQVNEHLQQGWKVINCNSIYYSQKNGMQYWAYLIKD